MKNLYYIALVFLLSACELMPQSKEIVYDIREIGTLSTTEYTVAKVVKLDDEHGICLLYTSPSPRDRQKSRMPSSA